MVVTDMVNQSESATDDKVRTNFYEKITDESAIDAKIINYRGIFFEDVRKRLLTTTKKPFPQRLKKLWQIYMSENDSKLRCK